MSNNKIVFILVAEQGYLRNINDDEDFSEQNDILFTAISQTYVPLLNMLSKFEAENKLVKMGLVLSAPLCTLLDDPQVQKQYIDYLDKKIELGESELIRNKNDVELFSQSERCLNEIKKAKIDYTEVYGQNLIEKFKYFASKDFLELIPTAATYAFLPHYSDMNEVLNAQIETGLHAHRHFFGETGDGFWLPYMGWFKGADRILRAYGINYTVLPTQAFLFSKEAPKTGIFSPLRSESSLALFAKDSDENIEDYSLNSVYQDVQKDIAFDLNIKDLSSFIGKKKVRVQTGYKYYANGDDPEENVLYNEESALAQVQKDAEAFYNSKCEKLIKASELMDGKESCDVVVIKTENLGQTWCEGMKWFEEVISIIEKDQKISLSLCRDLIDSQFSLPKIEPYTSAESGAGYGEDLLDSLNGWMMRYIRKANERMIDLTERFPSDTGLKARLLNLGARELLLAQSGDCFKMIHEKRIPEYVSQYFKKCIISFTTVFDSLGSNSVSTEWLTKLEKEHDIFPWLNYRVFSRKK